MIGCVIRILRGEVAIQMPVGTVQIVLRAIETRTRRSVQTVFRRG